MHKSLGLNTSVVGAAKSGRLETGNLECEEKEMSEKYFVVSESELENYGQESFNCGKGMDHEQLLNAASATRG